MTTGHCLCGAIHYEYDGEPTLVVHCHCESCRRQTASPVATFVIVPKAALRFTRGQPKEFSSSPGVYRSFCAECGSPLYYRTEQRPDVIDLYLGTLSEPGAITPQCQCTRWSSCRGSRSWMTCRDIPDHAGRTDPYGPGRGASETLGARKRSPS